MTKRDRALFRRCSDRAKEILEATPENDPNRKCAWYAAVMIRAGWVLLDPDEKDRVDAENLKREAELGAEVQP